MLISPAVLGLAFAAAMLLTTAAEAWACGSSSDCKLPDGTYRISLPERASDDDPTGAIVYLHGYQGSAAGVMDFAALRSMAESLGVVLIAPNGLDGSWGLPGVFSSRRDDVAFVTAAIDDAVARFNLDPDRIMISGFSLGGSMTWYLACTQGRRYAGYAPIAGAFWEPYMPDCVTPLPSLNHMHGRADKTVPLNGRKLSFATQGDVYRSFALLRTASGCEDDLGTPTVRNGLTCSQQTCGGAVQELCLHDGGHSVKPEWIARAWRSLAALNGWS